MLLQYNRSASHTAIRSGFRVLHRESLNKEPLVREHILITFNIQSCDIVIFFHSWSFLQ